VIAQSPTGWVDTRLKTAFLKLQLECPHNDLGKKPCFVNADGHDTNTRNNEATKLCEENNIALICPPAHTSAASRGGTQQVRVGVRLRVRVRVRVTQG
jgi:hypothetical protein